MSRLAVEGLGIGFGGVTALTDVSFNVEAGEIFAIIGPNGAGKTTLFNIVSGLYPPRQGRVRINDEDVTGMPPFKLARRGLSPRVSARIATMALRVRCTGAGAVSPAMRKKASEPEPRPRMKRPSDSSWRAEA